MATFNYDGYFNAHGSDVFVGASLSIETTGDDASYEYAYIGDSPGTPYFPSLGGLHAGQFTGVDSFTLVGPAETISENPDFVIHGEIVEYASRFETISILYILETTEGYYHFTLSGYNLNDAIMEDYNNYLGVTPVFGGPFSPELGFLLSETNHGIGGPSDEPMTVIGTSADEELFGGNADDIIYGGGGGDTIIGYDGNDTIIAEPEGDASVDGSLLGDFILAGDGDDFIKASVGITEVQGGRGADTIDATGGENVFASYQNSDDGVQIHLGANTAAGGEATGDTLINVRNIVGTHHDDVVHGNYLANSIGLLDGNDTAYGGSGNDVLNGGAGNDRLVSGNGDDFVFGEDGNDIVVGGSGNDDLNGGAGNDRLVGNGGDDALSGGADDDVLIGGAGNDLLLGDLGNDVSKGGAGNDTILDTNGTNRLFGEAGDDQIYGGLERDIMFGGDGNDRMNGGDGSDNYTGGAGADTFVFADGLRPLESAEPITSAGGRSIDRIFDFTQGEDLIELEHFFINDYETLQSRMSENNFGLRIDLNPLTSIYIKDMDMDTIQETDFVILDIPFLT